LYSLLSITLISTFTWLYFNFVENQLAFQVVERAPWLLVDEESDDADVDPGEGIEGDEGVPEDVPDPVPTGT